jgi:hypothetical protein
MVCKGVVGDGLLQVSNHGAREKKIDIQGTREKIHTVSKAHVEK